MSRSYVLPVLAMLVAAGSGCKSDVEQARDETLAIHEQALQILKDSVDDPDGAVRSLLELEEATRDLRKELRKKGKDQLEKMSEKKRTAFLEDSKKRHEEMARKFADLMRRYPEKRRHELQQLIATISAR